MVKTAKTNPTVFFATAARLIRQDVKLAVEQTYARLQEDYAVLKAIREATPDANNQSPQAVLEHVRDTLAAAQVKQIQQAIEPIALPLKHVKAPQPHIRQIAFAESKR